MFIDLNQKVDYYKTPFDTNEKQNFSIYAISMDGIKSYTSRDHYSHHYLNKYPKEILDLLNNEQNNDNYEQAKEFSKIQDLEKEEKKIKEKEMGLKKNIGDLNKINNNNNKKIEICDNHNERKYNPKDKVKTNVKEYKNINDKNASNAFKNYNKNIEKAMKFSSSLNEVQKKNNINSNYIKKYPKVKTSK